MKHPILVLMTALALSACTTLNNKPQPVTVIDKTTAATFSGQAVHATRDYVYVGAMDSGKRHGYGVSYFRNGLIQAGHWKQDQLEGEAVVISPEVGSVNAGTFSADEQVGPGVVVLDGEVVQGIFEQGKAAPAQPRCYREGQQIDCGSSGLL